MFCMFCMNGKELNEDGFFQFWHAFILHVTLFWPILTNAFSFWQYGSNKKIFHFAVATKLCSIFKKLSIIFDRHLYSCLFPECATSTFINYLRSFLDRNFNWSLILSPFQPQFNILETCSFLKNNELRLGLPK